MSVKKQFLKNKDVCKVTFRISKEIGKNYAKACLVGDFNNWNAKKHAMKKLKTDGSFSILVELETGNEYQFRYLLDGKVWLNEPEADKQVVSPFGDSENSVISL